MRVLEDTSVTTFAEHALPWLLRDPVRNNVAAQQIQMRATGSLPTEDGALWLRVLDGDELVSVALRTPPHALLLTAASREAITALADWCADRTPRLSGVNGPLPAVDDFAERWGALTGASASQIMGSRMFRLDQVIHPSGVHLAGRSATPGQVRPATPEDREMLVGWATAFHDEATPQAPRHDFGLLVDRKLAGNHLWVWQDGVPVSMLWTNPPTAGVVRVSGVYTPPAHRGHGYATACVAAVSQHELDAGAVACSLYTDLANPTSNKIYQAIGYRPVEDGRQWAFGYPD